MELLPVKNEKILDIVTEKIRDEILGGNYLPGDKLPSEREFIDQLQVSRIVVREALRKLEATGLLVVKRGSGMFVANTDSIVVHDAFSSALKMQKVEVLEILQAGLIIEPVIAELAAQNRTSEHIDALTENVDKAQELIDNGISSHHQNRDFHGIVAEATQNRVLRLSVEAVLHSLANVQNPSEDLVICGDDALIWHRKILRAIKERRPKETAKLMRDHITEIQKRLEQELKSVSVY
jgi:GntR family transcriptional repressor for pyruvate dehydrogenase complex